MRPLAHTSLTLAVLVLLASSSTEALPQGLFNVPRQASTQHQTGGHAEAAAGDDDVALEGPARDIPVLENADRIAAQDLEMEHRHDVTAHVVLPDIKDIPAGVFENLGVDVFFSLWFVFLNNKVEQSSLPFTILAPVNSSGTTPETLLQNEALAEDVIANHFLLGEEIRPETMNTNVERITAGGQNLHFRINEENGEMWVNDVQIVGWTKLEHGVIFAVEDYLFKEAITSVVEPVLPRENPEEKEVTNGIEGSSDVQAKPTLQLFSPKVLVPEAVQPTATPTSTTTTPATILSDGNNCTVIEDGDSIFKSIVVCIEDFEEPHKSDVVRRRSDDSALPLFLRDVADVLGSLRFASNDFLEYAQSVANAGGYANVFKDDTNYTALIPYDDAFREWYPVDWGFNPFEVESFVRETILDHILEGTFDKESVADGQTFRTLGGKEVRITKTADGKIKANGEANVVDGGAAVAHGALVFVDRLLFVDAARVSELNKEFGYLESAPLLQDPWYKSQFLSNAYELLSQREGYARMTKYMKETEKLGDYAQGYHNGDIHDGYTLFVPGDAAFPASASTEDDPLAKDEAKRLDLLLGQLAVGRFFSKDLLEGVKEIRTAANKTIAVQVKGKDIFLNDGASEAKIVGKELYVYNLGNVFFVDRVLFGGSLAGRATRKDTTEEKADKTSPTTEVSVRQEEGDPTKTKVVFAYNNKAVIITKQKQQR